MTKRRKHAEPRRFWTRGEVAVVREFYPWIPTREIAEDLGRTTLAVYQLAQKLELKKNEETFREACRWQSPRAACARHWFPKGHVPANKGTRRPGWAPGRMRETQFKKGQRPHSWRPIGSERLCDGYLQRKVTDTGYPPRDWKPVHVLMWEKANKRKVGCGFCIVFKDGDRTHIELSNLERISRAELQRRNTIHRLPEELKEVIRLKAAINHRLTTRERKMQHGEEQIKRSA